MELKVIESEQNVTEPSPQPASSLTVEQARASKEQLVKFRDAIFEGTFSGRSMIDVAKGLMFLEALIGQAQGQLELAKMNAKSKEKETLGA